MTVTRSTSSLDLTRWDALQPPGGFYATSPWLEHAERTADMAPLYLTAGTWEAAMPAYPLSHADPYVFCRVDHVLREITDREPPSGGLLPVLACGARNPGATFIATRPEVGQGVIRDIIGEAEELAADQGLAAVSYLYVSRSDTLLSSELARAGYAGFPGKPAYELDVPPTFDAYLSRFSRDRRSAIRREMKRLAGAGVCFRVEPLTRELAARLAPLEEQLYERYGTPGDAGTLGAILASIATNLSAQAEVVLAEVRDVTCGFTVVLSDGKELYARQTGYDYGVKGNLPLYFATVYYELIRLAQLRDIGVIHYGTGAGETKLSRGCREIETTAWVKSFDSSAQAGLARLAAG